MEVLAVIVVIFVIIWILGGADNNRPVSDWSDDKLLRMHRKLLYAASVQAKANKYEKIMEYTNKAKEVAEEIERRKKIKIKELGEKTLDNMTIQEFSELSRLMAEQSLNLIKVTMQTHLCSEEEAMEIISKKIERLTDDYMEQGLSKDDASEKAMQVILGMNS